MPETARLSPGDPAPDFTLPDADGTPVALSDLRGRKVVAVRLPGRRHARLHRRRPATSATT